MKRILYLLIIFISLLACNNAAYCVVQPRPMSVDSRLQVINYKPDDVIKFTGFYGYQSIIEFSQDEEIENISMGDTTSWQIVPINHRIFLKPMEDDAVTNMTIITNKRLYYFEMHADNAQSIDDPRLVFNMKFLYPDDGYEALGMGGFNKSKSSDDQYIDLSHPEKYNFNYTVSGSEAVTPIKLFDDGEFTYIQFRDKNADMPAIFLVDKDNRESLVNYRVSGPYIVVERVASKMTLRRGNDVACIFNQNLSH